jgi:cobalamin biosynthesis protein CobT
VKRRIIAAGQYSASNVELQNNVDGESVLTAAKRLLTRREPRKVMIVLSDGQPSAVGIPAHLQSHLKRAVQTCEDMGIEMIGIGIETDSVKYYYPKHVVLRHANELPAAVMGELKRFLIARN